MGLRFATFLLIVMKCFAITPAARSPQFEGYDGGNESFITLTDTSMEAVTDHSTVESFTTAASHPSVEPKAFGENTSLPEETPNPMEQKRAWFNRHFELASDVLLWWNVIISPIGILGNVMCILVVFQKHNRGVSCSIYMGALAVADTVMLIGNLAQIIMVFPLKFLAFSLFQTLCKIDYYVMFTAAHCGVMLILAMLAERVIAVTKPLDAARLLSPKKAVYIIIGICLFCVTYNIPRALVTSSTVPDRAMNRSGHCTILTTDLAVGYNFSSFFVIGVIPLFAISIMNIVILFGVRAAAKKITRQANYEASDNTSVTKASTTDSVDLDKSSKDETENNKNQPISTVSKGSSDPRSSREERSASKVPRSGQRSRYRQERQLTLMTIVMTTVFLVCTMPRYAHHLTFAAIEATSSLDRYVIYVWSASTTSNLLALNSAINFYLYVMTGSKFRADVIKLLRCKGD